VALRIRVMSAPLSARFWFSAFCVALMPTSVGYQDLAALVAHERSTDAGWHLLASPFGTIEAATFRYTRPVGSAIPQPFGFQTVSFDPRSLDAYAWKIDEPLTMRHARQIEYPSVNRERKGDRLPATPNPAGLPQLEPLDAPAASPAPPPQPEATEQGADGSGPEPLVVQTDIHADASTALAPAVAEPTEAGAATASPLEAMSFLDDEDDGQRSAALYFGPGVMGSPAGLQSWAPGAAPILAAPSEDSGIKLAALEGADYGAEEGGETIAGKDDLSRMQTPAQRLGLEGKSRARAEKCLTQAVYFEARGEPLQGQQAVAQVVMNRVFSGYYPHDVCGVVFQNAERHLACQFTFACEGKDLSLIDEPDMWEQAKRIAKDSLDGKVWLADIGHATHYHAYWVHPSWVHEMVRLYKLGVHTFYRPRNWGDGDDEPVWGAAGIAKFEAEPTRPDPEVLSEKPEPPPAGAPTGKGREAAADKSAPTAKL